MSELASESCLAKRPAVILSAAKDLMPVASGDEVLRCAQDDMMYSRLMSETHPVILVRDWRSTEAALLAARANGTSPVLVTPEGAASFYGAGYLGALQERAEKEFPDVDFTLIVDCDDAPGHALACLRAGVKRISMEPFNDKIADIARQMGAQLVRRPT
jgi:hypothetical protein